MDKTFRGARQKGQGALVTTVEYIYFEMMFAVVDTLNIYAKDKL